jgi:predicted NUDIX family NTP pyrophosphohydrolase
MAKQSAGILLFRFRENELQVFLVHPGGPYWAKKDDGAWSLPKGEFGDDEDGLTAAKREFTEETGFDIDGRFIPLNPVKQKGGKTVYAWAVEGDIDATALESNTFTMEWPPRSGRRQAFPEIDRADWFNCATAEVKILQGQRDLIHQLQEMKI